MSEQDLEYNITTLVDAAKMVPNMEYHKVDLVMVLTLG